MRTPTRAMAGHLRWTRSGSVWAEWILTGIPYGLRPEKDKHAARAMHAGLLRALPGESLLLGVVAGLDPAVVVEHMIDGVDLADCPHWAAECEATLDSLDRIGLGQRVFWLSVPLTADRPSDRVMGPLRAQFSDLRDTLGLPREQIPAQEIHRRQLQAKRVADGIPAVFEPVPATTAQKVWLHQHMLNRGRYHDLDLPTSSEGDLAAALLTPKSGAALAGPWLDEGGQSDLDGGRFDVRARRFLKVADSTSAGSQDASYQSMLVLADVPDAGFAFPGGEVIGRIDECGLDVDWAIRLTVRSSAEVAAKNSRSMRNLNEQYSQRSGEVSFGMNMLDRVGQDLAEYAAILEADKLEVETQSTIIFSVAGESAEHATLQARGLADYLAGSGNKVAMPLGAQEELWWAMHPGVACSSVVREYAQITTSRNLAALVPFASTRLGNHSGSPVALNISNGPLLSPTLTCGPTAVVMHDLEGASDRDMSGSMAIAGELGSGKTSFLMRVAGDVIDRHGQLVIADRTAKGEWARWAESIQDAVVVDPAAPTHSLDPLRMLGPDAGAEAMQAFLTPLLNISPTEPRGVLLAEVLNPDYLRAHQLHCAGDVIEHLSTGCTFPGAGDLGSLLNVFARKSYGRVIFDPAVPNPVTLSTEAIVVRTHGLPLPSREELEREHLFRQLTPDKIFGRAFNALIAALARRICFADTSRLAGFVVSEAHAMTISFEGERELVDAVRDGRKHRAVVLLDSHDPLADFGSPTLRGLIPTRIQMRQRDRILARRGLQWLDLDPDDDDLLRLITDDTAPIDAATDMVPLHRRGEALMRDMAHNVGRIKGLLPARSERAEAIVSATRAATRGTGPSRPTQAGAEQAGAS